MERRCKKHNRPEHYSTNPYTPEIDGEVEYIWLCDECYYDLCLES